jgi:hypothetical protein
MGMNTATLLDQTHPPPSITISPHQQAAHQAVSCFGRNGVID